MNADNVGTAREVPPGRLAHFEDADADPAPQLSLPPRPRRQAAVKANGVEPRPGRQEVERLVDGGEDPQPSRQPSRTKGPKDRVRPSNVHIPVRLWEPLAQLCQRQGLSHGEAIIVALEDTHPRLKDLIRPAITTGGSLFDTRRSRAARSADGPLTPLNYRLREADFEVLDGLVEQVGASSRGHLITVALTEYLAGRD